MKIGVVVLNYNKKELLNKCLKSLKKVNYKDLFIVVVDNGSSDGSGKLVRDEFNDVILIENGYNAGFCQGNNIGIKKALNKGAEAVFILNNDTEVEPNLLNVAVQTIDVEGKIGMLALKIILMQDYNTIDNTGFLITPDGLGKNDNAGKPFNESIRIKEVFCPSGAATFYCRELLEDIKYNDEFFDEDFKYCYEELDLGWRARLRGWKCLFVPAAVVYHHKSATAGKFSKIWAYYSNRNIIFNIIKNYPSTYLLIKALLLSLLRYPLLAGGLFFNKGVGYKIKNNLGFYGIISITFISFKDALIKMKKMLKKRKYIQKRKNVNKKEIKRWFGELGVTFFDSIYKL